VRTSVAEAAQLAVVIGSPGVDIFPPAGVVGEGHVPGAKNPNPSPADLVLIENSLERAFTDQEVDALPGGGALDVIAYLACRRAGTVRLVTVLGDESDPASRFVHPPLNELEPLGADCHSYTPIVQGFHISASLIERDIINGEVGNRMARIRRGDEKWPYLDQDHIAEAVKGAGLVVAASVKDPKVWGHVFTGVPEEGFLAVNWGSCDLSDDLGNVQGQMRERNPGLLTANEHEMLRIVTGESNGKKKITVDEALGYAETASRQYAEYVLCTLGAAGMVYANNGSAEFLSALPDPPGPIHTLGAGDRILAVAADCLSRGHTFEEALLAANMSANQVIMYEGAYGDLYDEIRRANQPARAAAL
jgi:pfkB family carbohydrate kinase